MSAADELLEHNVRYAETHDGSRPAVPSRHVSVVTCMDARIDVHAMLGLGLGEAHVIRNAGGVVTDDVVRSLAISQRKLKTDSVLVIHHTQCGLLDFDEAGFVAELTAEGAAPPAWRPGSFADVDEDVRSGVAALRSSPYLSATQDIRGFVFDVATGLLREVE
jgi:carbonic anhydrase